MKRGIRQWKRYAREVLGGNYGKPVLGTIAIFMLNLIGGNLTVVLFPGYTTLAIILSQVFAFVLSLILWVFSAGYSYMLMNLSRGKACSLKDMIYFFKNQPDRLITAGFVLALINVLCSVPMNYFSITAAVGSTLEAQMAWMRTYSLLMVFSVVFTMILSLPFSVAVYLLVDEPEMGGFEALKKSMKMMKGHIRKYLLLQVSFIPWLILSMFTLYIAMLWVFPYMEMASVMFYRDLRGEFDPAPEGTKRVSGTVAGSIESRTEDFSAQEDDYTSEV